MFSKTFSLVLILGLIGIIIIASCNLHMLVNTQSNSSRNSELEQKLAKSKWLNILIIIIAAIILIYFIFLLFSFYGKKSNSCEVEYVGVESSGTVHCGTVNSEANGSRTVSFGTNYPEATTESNIVPKQIVSPLRSGGRAQSKNS